MHLLQYTHLMQKIIWYFTLIDAKKITTQKCNGIIV